MTARPITATAETIAKAGELLRDGKLVAFPTETVYGLGADATSDTAVASIFAAKNRPTFNPLIVHVADMEAARALVVFDSLAEQLAAAFWPGPLSLVLPRRPDCPVSLLASAGLDTIAVRMPAHGTARAILAAASVPIAAPSANASGAISPTRADHVADSLGNNVDLILDDGPCQVGIESTVVACLDGTATLLRPGGLAIEDIEAVTGPVQMASGDPDQPASPGMLASHYAPDAALRLNATSLAGDEGLLAFGSAAPAGDGPRRNLSPTGDLREAAANLFAMLRELDGISSAIAVVPIPQTGLGRAINDRLVRAAAPRDA